MKMELIQPFVSAVDTVLAETMESPAKVSEVTMEEQAYRPKGLAALVKIHGDIEGRVILDMEPSAAVKAAGYLAGNEVEESEELVRETVCEVASMVIGNAVTLLNDQGFRFKVHPPEVHTSGDALTGTQDTEALLLCFETRHGVVNMNIAMRYNRRRGQEPAVVVTE